KVCFLYSRRRKEDAAEIVLHSAMEAASSDFFPLKTPSISLPHLHPSRHKAIYSLGIDILSPNMAFEYRSSPRSFVSIILRLKERGFSK
ncbi:MAG: hypothetical protein IIT37_01295, partial [Bacteroidales bacterium]|nr:hypothetical protein [Bacteroidales bacterium]